MENSAIPINSVLQNAYASIDHLLILLRLVDNCFKYLQVERAGNLRYELTYDYGDDYEHQGVDTICEDLKSSIKRQFDSSHKIDGSVYLNFYQGIAPETSEENLRYTGILRIFDNACFIRFLWHQTSDEIRINISRHLAAEEVVNTFIHFQEAILDQLKRLSNEQ